MDVIFCRPAGNVCRRRPQRCGREDGGDEEGALLTKNPYSRRVQNVVIDKPYEFIPLTVLPWAKLLGRSVLPQSSRPPGIES
jgi:hypothetical protein